ncbi:16S rRNA (cytidine(1402)-2'-O)-methyltransferase [Maribius pontilimi]|uniref:Ribosomal RNA small subunit methyltransferase I n=1 Tax=Palleronia pontilimi TaxID=1964209 RepID=A0A934MEE2_9RHOB|nr:16S rRNA (cytidine(1402)-2'-O)-methyltransferase [Palleronia pontilimi]MBJ3763366.1 16S rRNA (cytidine(1402)-2'-O)-methyltransferase [Palleronia pontilimi]
MSAPSRALGPGLYLVATPIGNARDITLRALDVLKGADLLLAEDTRTLRKLMEIHGIPLGGRRVWAYHDHNGAAVRPKVLQRIAEGASVAFASDAGMPLVADPGFDLARAVAQEGFAITSVPGASAPLAALSLAGLPSDRFLFAGFLPATQMARAAVLRDLADTPATLIFFETAKRCLPMLKACQEILGDRQAAICRELTKKFEEVRRGRLSELVTGCEVDPPRGELVVVIDRGEDRPSEDDMEAALRRALGSMGVKDAAAFVAQGYGVKKRDAYQMALRLSQEDEER